MWAHESLRRPAVITGNSWHTPFNQARSEECKEAHPAPAPSQPSLRVVLEVLGEFSNDPIGLMAALDQSRVLVISQDGTSSAVELAVPPPITG